MKQFLAICAVLAAMSAGTTFAAEGDISPSVLADMGLSSITVMSDVEGLKVRGTGYVAYGQAFAAVSIIGGGASGYGAYYAGSSSLAAGASGVVAFATGAPLYFARGASIASN